MRKSEIFEAFAKKMEDQEKSESNKAKDLLEKNPRMSALTPDDIRKLYNVKPDSPKEMHYKNNIMEYAHKGNVVVSPSYDKLNGLVENNIERQNILLHIVNKPTNGLLTNHKYAEKELVLSLVSLGNHLDNVHKDDLRTLADTCLTQVAGKTLQKKALAPLAWAALVGIPSLIGAIYAQQHLPNVDRGFKQNHAQLVSELDDLLNSNSNFGVGTTYTAQFVSVVTNFKNKIEEFYNLYVKNEAIIANLETPKTAKDLMQLANQPVGAEAVRAYTEMLSSFMNLLPLINSMERNLKSESFKGRQVEEKGFLTSLIDKTEILHGNNGLIADDFQDVANAIPPYKKSVQEIIKVFYEAQNLQNKAKQDLEQAATESASLIEPSKSTKEVDDEAGDLGKQLEDLSKDFPNML